jgi:hypothetical protein
MIDKRFAEDFASDWIDSWNSHNLDRIFLTTRISSRCPHPSLFRL